MLPEGPPRPLHGQLDWGAGGRGRHAGPSAWPFPSTASRNRRRTQAWRRNGGGIQSRSAFASKSEAPGTGAGRSRSSAPMPRHCRRTADAVPGKAGRQPQRCVCSIPVYGSAGACTRTERPGCRGGDHMAATDRSLRVPAGAAAGRKVCLPRGSNSARGAGTGLNPSRFPFRSSGRPTSSKA